MDRSRGQKVLSASTAASRSETKCARGRGSVNFPLSQISRTRGPAAEPRAGDKLSGISEHILYTTWFFAIVFQTGEYNILRGANSCAREGLGRTGP